MSKAIAAVLRDAAFGPAPFAPMVAWSWLGMHTPAHIWLLEFCGNPHQIMPDMNNNERRMFLLFCSLAAEDEE